MNSYKNLQDVQIYCSLTDIVQCSTLIFLDTRHWASEFNKSQATGLSPPQRPLCIVGRLLCCGEAGEKEKESARGTLARFLFLSIIDILMGIPSGSLCGGERATGSKKKLKWFETL